MVKARIQIMEKKISDEGREMFKDINKRHRTIKTYKLKEKKTGNEYRDITEDKFRVINNREEEITDIEDM